MEIQQINNWEKMLSKCISDLREKYPRFNDGQIADKISMSRPTFNRLVKGQKTPRIDNVLKMVLGSGNQKILGDVVSLFDEHLGNSLKTTLSVALREENKIFTHGELENLLDDRDVFVAYLLASNQGGTDSFQLTEALGNSSKSAINTLLKKGIVKEEKNRYIVANKGTLVRSFDSIKRHLTTYSRFYNPEHVGKERNYVHSLTEGLNIEGVKKVQAAHKKLHEQLQEIYRDPANKGNLPSFSVAFCDTFTSINNDQNLSKGGLQ